MSAGLDKPTKAFQKNPSFDNNSVISKTSSRDTPEEETDPVQGGAAKVGQESGAGSSAAITPALKIAPNEDVHPPREPSSLLEQEGETETEAEQGKNSTKLLVNRGEPPEGDNEIFSREAQLVTGSGERPTLGETPAESPDESMTDSLREPVAEVGGEGTMMMESMEETQEPVHRITIPPEYEFSIPQREFSSENNHISSWRESREYSKGATKLKTTIGLSADICQTTGSRMTSAVVLIRVLNFDRDCSYSASARVILHDPLSGTLLSEIEEKRDFEDSRDHIKFEVSVGSQANIEQCRGRELKLQVKVRVQEKAYWQNIKKMVYTKPTHGP